ncbi:MAG: hypothetical protein CMJ34_14825 [Phycisphaerae bacterium]|nr:hypothetical protein [Phycisphaerae bacterium]
MSPRLRSRSRRGAACLVAVLLAFLSAGTPGSADTMSDAGSPGTSITLIERHWFRCTLGGHPCGRMTEVTERLDDGASRTSIDLELRFRRGTVETSTRIRTWIELGDDGAMTAMGIRQELGGVPVSTTWMFEGEEVLERRSQGGRTVESRRPRPSGDWHVPERAMEIARARADAGEAAATRLLVLDPARGLEPAIVEFRRTGTRPVRGPGGEVEAVRWEITDPGGSVAVEFFDAEGVLLSSEVSMGAGLGGLRIERSTEADAEIAFRGDVELMEAGVVEPVFKGRKRRLDRGGAVTYRITGRDGIPAPEFPAAGAQRVEVIEMPAANLIEVETGRSSPVGPAFDRARHLEATSVLDATDPEVAAFTNRHDRPGRPTLERVRALRSAVHRHIDRKDLGTAFGTASETVRSRRGDCTEHAVLLAAALRSAGIPSRLASGLVWIPRKGGSDGAFLWHMWTQAVIGDRWIDLDATLGGTLAFHPGHIAVSFSDGGAGDLETGGRAMLDVFGAIDIEVLEPGTGIGSHDTDEERPDE